MPPPDQMTVTLAVLRTQIAERHDISLRQYREMCSAINSFARLCNKTPADIIADPAIIRGLAQRAPWKLAGLKKGSWLNIISRLTKALAIGGVAVHRQRRNFKLDEAWAALLAPLARRDRDELRRFAGWCSAYGIAPSAVAPETFNHFLSYLEGQMIQRNPRERGHVARRAWNRSVSREGSPYPQIPPPPSNATRALRWEDFPTSLQAEVNAYRERAVKQALFDAEHLPIKPVTLDNYLNRLRVYLTTLVKNGEPTENFTSLSAVVEPSMMRRGLELRLGTRMLDDRARKDLHGIPVAALNIARCLGLDEQIRAELKAIEKVVRFRASGMCEKNKQRLLPLFDPGVRRTLLNLPDKVANELRKVTSPTARQAQRMQMACLLDILLHVPMRIRNAAELDLERTISPPIGGKVGNWRISIAKEDVKNEVAIDAPLGDHPSDLLDLYLKRFRPVLMVGPTSALFISQRGTPKGPSALSKQLAGFVRREVGVTLHAHLMRHLAAHLYLIVNPGDYETVRRLLGHKSIETTIKFYEGMMTGNAFLRYEAVIDRVRKATDPSEQAWGEAEDLEAGDMP